jgi:hypothetical protein
MHAPRFTRSALACAMLALLPLAAWAATAADVFPPPGLYRVDIVSDTAIRHGGKNTAARHTHDSARGLTTLQGTRADGSALTPKVMDGAPGTTCIAPLRPDRSMAPSAGCTGGPGVAGQDRMTFDLSCGGLKMTTVVRELDQKTWEYRTRTTDDGSMHAMPGQQDFAGMRAMLEHTARTGSAQEKAEAAALLAEMGPCEAHMKQNAADIAAARRAGAMAGADPVRRDTATVQRLTRIADSRAEPDRRLCSLPLKGHA